MNIGWIGTGVMGLSMASHIQNNGYQLFVSNRTKEKAASLLDHGAVWCKTPAEVANNADIVFTMVGFPRDVEETYMGDSGILSSTGCKCRTVVDMTTTQPSLSEKIAERAKQLGISALDAPVSGGDIGAREARLVIMVGGDKKTFEDIMPLFKLMGTRITLMGKPGAGQHTKMCNQILVAGAIISVCESMLYAVKSGLNTEDVIDLLEKGAAASWTLSNLAPRIFKNDFKSGFFVEHFVKDMGIVLKEAESMGICLPGLSLVHQLYVGVRSQGMGRFGTQSLYLALKRICGMD